MDFVPAGKIIGEAHQVRTVGLRDSRQLPDGDYRFVDTYCTDLHSLWHSSMRTGAQNSGRITQP